MTRLTERAENAGRAGDQLKTIKTVTLVGNPKIGSRTLKVAEEVTRQIASRLGSQDLTVANVTVDVAELGSGLLEWNNETVSQVLQRVAKCDLLVVASPVYKASYTGVLKLLLDQLPFEGLAGRIAIPVMVAAAPIHALAIETHFRPLLIELGASCPTRGLVIIESQLDELSAIVGKWLDKITPTLTPLLANR